MKLVVNYLVPPRYGHEPPLIANEFVELERSTTMFGRLADPKGSNIALAQVLYGLALRSVRPLGQRPTGIPDP
jgi:hypothetical protein